jgi:hypothetical protein
VVHIVPGDPANNIDRLIKGEADFIMTYTAAHMTRQKAKTGHLIQRYAGSQY